MDHRRAQELLGDYLDGELDGETLKALERHLETCDLCREEVRGLRAALTVLGSLKAVEPPEDFLQQVNQKIKRRTKSLFDISFGLERKIPFEAVSMVLIGILIALYLLLVVLPREQVDHAPPEPHPVILDAGVPDSGERPFGKQ